MVRASFRSQVIGSGYSREIEGDVGLVGVERVGEPLLAEPERGVVDPDLDRPHGLVFQDRLEGLEQVDHAVGRAFDVDRPVMERQRADDRLGEQDLPEVPAERPRRRRDDLVRSADRSASGRRSPSAGTTRPARGRRRRPPGDPFANASIRRWRTASHDPRQRREQHDRIARTARISHSRLGVAADDLRNLVGSAHRVSRSPLRLNPPPTRSTRPVAPISITSPSAPHGLGDEGFRTTDASRGQRRRHAGRAI